MKMISLPPLISGGECDRIVGRRVRTPESQCDSTTLHPKVDASCDLLNFPAHCQTHQFLHENMLHVTGCYRCIMM